MDIYLQHFMRIQTPRLSGVIEPKVVKDWLMRIEKTLDEMHCPHERRVALPAFLLDGEAEHWWLGK